MRIRTSSEWSCAATSIESSTVEGSTPTSFGNDTISFAPSSVDVSSELDKKMSETTLSTNDSVSAPNQPGAAAASRSVTDQTELDQFDESGSGADAGTGEVVGAGTGADVGREAGTGDGDGSSAETRVRIAPAL